MKIKSRKRMLIKSALALDAPLRYAISLGGRVRP